MYDPVTSDLRKFGSPELRMARDLLTAYLENNDTQYLSGTGLRIMMNKDSGHVFLSDEDCNVALEVGGRLEDFIVCSYCGHEDVRSDFEDDDHAIINDEVLCRDEGTFPADEDDENDENEGNEDR